MLNAGKIVKLPMMRLGVPIAALALQLGMLIIYMLCLHNHLRLLYVKIFQHSVDVRISYIRL